MANPTDPQVQSLSFDDLGAKTVLPAPVSSAPPAARTKPLDFSDLGATRVTPPVQAGPQTPSLNNPDPTARLAVTGTGTISAVHEPTTMLGKLGRWSENVANDIKYGTDETGIGTVLKKMGAHGVYSGNSEQVGDFMASLPLGLLRSTKGATELAPEAVGGPRGKTWQGVKDVVGGGLQAATIPASFVAPEESALSKEGLLSDAASVAGKATSKVGEAASAVKRAATAPFSTKQLQPEFQQGIRDVIGTVAKDTETAAPTAKSIRNVVEQAADNVYAKSKAQYQVLDQATNGRVQRFTDRLQNIRQQLNSLTGTEEDIQKEASLLKAQKETEEAMQDAFNDAKTKGVDPTLVDQASANFKKSQALYDLDSHLKKATTGMRPNVGGPQQAAKNPELVDPTKLFNRVNNLYDSGRLQEALGEGGANNLLEHVNDTLVRHKQILRNQGAAKAVAKVAGLGATLATGAKVTHIFSPETGLSPIQ